MAVPFNADDIFEMAEQIERNGAKYYRTAAGNFSDNEVKQFLNELARMEDDHEKTFAGMRAELSTMERGAGVPDPDGQAVMYLQAMADGHVFDTKTDPSEKLTGRETLADILRTAIGMEKDSIVFYLGLVDGVSAGETKVRGIIAEEMSHITLLSGKLAELKK